MIELTVEGLELINRNLASITNPATKKAVIRAVAREIRKKSVQRVVRQTNLDGSAFKKHSKGRKRKMIVRLARRIKVHSVTDTQGEVGWRNSFEGKLAAKHHFGFKEHVTAASFKTSGRSDTNAGRFDDATRRQAKALLAEGYKVKRSSGRGYASPSIKWITQNMNIGRAGIILRALRGGAVSEWDTVTPPRQFLGINESELGALNDIVKQQINKAMERRRA